MLKEPVKKRRHLANEEFSWKIAHALSVRYDFYRAGAWRRSILCSSRRPIMLLTAECMFTGNEGNGYSYELLREITYQRNNQCQ